MWASDYDKTSAWKDILKTAGKIATDASPLVTTLDPTTGVVFGIAGAVGYGAAELIPMGADERLGSRRILLTSVGRWATGSERFAVDLKNEDGKRGPVRVFLSVDELPPSWTVKIIG
jgi:hypothetical protein